MHINVLSLDSGRLLVNAEFLALLRANGVNSAEALWSLGGDIVKRVLKERGTERAVLSDSITGAQVEVYLKRYTRRPLREVIKSAFSLKFKNFGAFEEWDSLLAFHEAGLPTLPPIAVAKCKAGDCGLTLGVQGFTRASELYPQLKTDAARRRALIAKTASLAASMHKEGMAHQDFYLVHLFIMPGDKLLLIDLQRMFRQKALALRWVVKDLGQLMFSAKPNAQPGDVALFLRVYAKGRGLKLDELKALVKHCAAKAETISRHDAKRAKKS